jgi:hypothetical protein
VAQPTDRQQPTPRLDLSRVTHSAGARGDMDVLKPYFSCITIKYRQLSAQNGEETQAVTPLNRCKLYRTLASSRDDSLAWTVVDPTVPFFRTVLVLSIGLSSAFTKPPAPRRRLLPPPADYNLRNAAEQQALFSSRMSASKCIAADHPHLACSVPCCCSNHLKWCKQQATARLKARQFTLPLLRRPACAARK